MCDILCTADDIASTLSHQTTVFMMSHPLQAWHHTPCIRHCTQCIFFITISPLISRPFLNDITPTFCVTSYALYITSHSILMSSHYCTYDITTSISETTSSMYGNIYTIQETSQPLSVSSLPLYSQHHTHSLYDITLTICVALFALYKISHPHFMTSNHSIYVITPTIFDIMSTVSVSSHPLYWWYHTNCISEITSAIIHNIISIVYDMTATVWTSQPLHSWYQIPYIWHHLQGLWHLVPYTCDITDTMLVNTCQLYLTSNTRC